MKVVVIKNNLKEGIAAVERAAGENVNLPILKNVLLETEDNKLKLTTTNLEIAASFCVSGKIIENGKTTVPLSIFSGLIANISSERIDLENKKNVLEIKTDNYQAAIHGISADEFPLIPRVKNLAGYIEIESGVLKEAFSQTIIASQFSELRPELNNIFVDFSLDNLKLVTTDSFRLAEKTLMSGQFQSNHQEPFTLLLPLRSGQEALRILGDEGKVRLYHDETQILFKTDRAEFFSRLMEGTFPDYRAVVPQKFSAEMNISRQELLSALKLAGIFSTRTNEVKMNVLENKKAVGISSSDQAIGENTYVLPAKFRGDAKEMSFSWRYLSDGLKALKTDEVFLGLNEDNKPALLKSPNDASYFYLLMPILKT